MGVSKSRMSLFLGICIAVAPADLAFAQRRINPIVLAPSARDALPRQTIQVDGAWAAPLEPFFDMDDWLPFLAMLGILPLARNLAPTGAAPLDPGAWLAFYGRHPVPPRRLGAHFCACGMAPR